MQKNLVIVESPAKAKTIEKFLGKDYSVMSSYGHIRDLKANEFSIDVEHGFKPEYVIPEDKMKVVTELKSAAKKSEQIWLASDEDREGEAISWHLSEVLNLDKKNSKRIVFHEITKDAILHAIETPREINEDLVNAQQARRILDRIVGFELSPILWRKVKPSLSAGRVQSVTVRLIVDREREINNFQAESFYNVTAAFILPDGSTALSAELNKKFKTKEEAEEFLEACKSANFNICDISKKPIRKTPAPPFTTSTLQQEAARKLGFPVSLTMNIAQKLYEAGLITYMRTDSVNLSNLALGTAKEAIVSTYGEEFYQFRTYHTTSKGAQEAHEAIRPTYISRSTIEGTKQEQLLYDLIRKRTIACQMADAELERTIVTISVSGRTEAFLAVGEVMQFEGFLKVYLEGKDDDSEEKNAGILPKVDIDDPLSLKSATAKQSFTKHPQRYTEASLVHKLEELGIGRPSTYAPTIQTILNRGYVVKGDKEGKERDVTALTLSHGKIKETTKVEKFDADFKKMLPTDMGFVVTDFLTSNFPDIIDYNFTATEEKDFDAIADGEKDWENTIADFYKRFHPVVVKTANTKTEHKAGERLLGNDPKSGKPVYVKIGRFGPVAQIGDAHTPAEGENDDKPTFAKLMKDQSIETITLEEALKLFDLPRTIGEFEGKEMVAAIGRFGPFIRHDGKFTSIPKAFSPLTITQEEAIQLIEDKRKQLANRTIKTFDEDSETEILNGRFGPYITSNKANYKIPKTVKDPASLTLEDCKKIIAEAAEKPASPRGRFTRKKS